MGYFGDCLDAKRVIEKDQNLVSGIVSHMSEESSLEVIGEGTSNTVFRVGKTDSGLHVAMRENNFFSKIEEDGLTSAYIYNSYCLDAEKRSSSQSAPPSFCVCGFFNRRPFLLVEDVTEGGKWNYLYSRSGDPVVELVSGNSCLKRTVDIGDDEVRGVDRDLYERLMMGDFDVEELKYFKADVRLDL